MIVLGKAQEEPLTEGLYFKPPFVAKVQRYDVTVQKYQIKASGQSKDLQELTATFALWHWLLHSFENDIVPVSEPLFEVVNHSLIAC